MGGAVHRVGPRPWTRHAVARIAGALLALCGLPCPAADIFASVGVDDSIRYSNHRLDDSYALVISDHRPAVPAPQAGKPSAGNLRPLIERAAARHGVAPELVGSVVAVESGHNASARSSKGARGAMQLMPATARQYGIGDASTLNDPERNIEAGVRHLKSLLERYQGNVALALSAYNAGEGAISRHGDRIPPFRETMLYVPAVLARTATPGR